MRVKGVQISVFVQRNPPGQSFIDRFEFSLIRGDLRLEEIPTSILEAMWLEESLVGVPRWSRHETPASHMDMQRILGLISFEFAPGYRCGKKGSNGIAEGNLMSLYMTAVNRQRVCVYQEKISSTTTRVYI